MRVTTKRTQATTTSFVAAWARQQSCRCRHTGLRSVKPAYHRSTTPAQAGPPAGLAIPSPLKGIVVRVRFAPVALALLFAVASCGGGSQTPAEGASDVDLPVGGDLNTAVPACPFTAEKVSQLVGQPMVDEGNCLFGDGKGVASVTITTSSELAGPGTYDYKRESAGKRYGEVTDVQKGDKAYIAVGDIEAEAVMIREDGSYPLTIARFSFDKAKYGQIPT